jgi:hypothetical protein
LKKQSDFLNNKVQKKYAQDSSLPLDTTISTKRDTDCTDKSEHKNLITLKNCQKLTPIMSVKKQFSEQQELIHNQQEMNKIINKHFRKEKLPMIRT